MTFPANNLPTASRTWGREVEKKVSNLESSFRSAEVNNVTRDSQLSVTANAALSAATQAQAAAGEASTAAAAASQAAIQAQAAANTANSAITALGQLDEETSTYKINAANLTVGNLSGDRIRGGVITGTQLTTADPGNQRVVLNSNTITLNNGSSDTGSIFGSTYGGTAATYIQGNACVLSSTQGNYFIGTTGVFSGSFSAENGISTPAAISANGNITSVSGTVKGSFVTATDTVSGVSVSGGSITSNPGGSITSGGALIRSQLGSDGLGLTGASVTSSGAFVRTSSSERYKQDIEDLQVSYESVLSLNPKTFRRKDEVAELGESAKIYPGFIAEEIADSELDIFAFYSIDENGAKVPEGVHYPELTAALVCAIKHQDLLIKDLNARLEALESR